MKVWLKHNNRYWTCHEVDRNRVLDSDKVVGGIILKKDGTYSYFAGYPGPTIDYRGCFEWCQWVCEQKINSEWKKNDS